MVQRLRLHASNATSVGLILCWGTKIPLDEWHSQKRKKKTKKAVWRHLSDYLLTKSVFHRVKRTPFPYQERHSIVMQMKHAACGAG